MNWADVLFNGHLLYCNVAAIYFLQFGQSSETSHQANHSFISDEYNIFIDLYVNSIQFNSIQYLHSTRTIKWSQDALQSPGPEPPWNKHNGDKGKEKLPLNRSKPYRRSWLPHRWCFDFTSSLQSTIIHVSEMKEAWVIIIRVPPSGNLLLL